MEKIHRDIGLPLKTTYADIRKDAEVLKKLGKENEDNPTKCLFRNIMEPHN